MFRSLLRAAIAAFLMAPGLMAAEDSKTSPAETPRAPLVKLSVFPAKVELSGPRDEQRIGVVGEYADGRTWDLTRTAINFTDRKSVV